MAKSLLSSWAGAMARGWPSLPPWPSSGHARSHQGRGRLHAKTGAGCTSPLPALPARAQPCCMARLGLGAVESELRPQTLLSTQNPLLIWVRPACKHFCHVHEPSGLRHRRGQPWPSPYKASRLTTEAVRELRHSSSQRWSYAVFDPFAVRAGQST